MTNGLTSEIICVFEAVGSMHDFEMWKQSGIRLLEWIVLLADKGFQGIAQLHANSLTPFKKSKKQQLSPEQKRFNRSLGRDRIKIEHVNRWIKRFKILSYRYRNKQRKHLLRVSLICGFYNFELGF